MDDDERTQILDLLTYTLTHVDGARWVSRILLATPESTPPTLTLGGVLVPPDHALPVANAIAEAGIIACRRLLNFLGIRYDHQAKTLAPMRDNRREDTTIQDLGLSPVRPDQLDAPSAPVERVQEACANTILAANKGVAHMTLATDRSLAEDLRLCAEATTRAVETFVFGALGVPVPQYKVWTGPHPISEVSVCGTADSTSSTFTVSITPHGPGR